MATNTERINGLEKELKSVKSDISNMNQNLTQILSLLTANSNNQDSDEPLISTTIENTDNEYIPEEPDLSQNIRIKSLYVGSLNLSYGDGKSIQFTNYGQECPVLYRDLISIVNMNRRFSDTGYFYITNPSAVYHLGLSETYKHILDFKTIENICTMNIEQVENVVSNVTDYQKSLIAERLAMKMANGENVDRNIIARIDKILGADIEGTAYKIENVINRK